jgi:hypothetical protein
MKSTGYCEKKLKNANRFFEKIMFVSRYIMLLEKLGNLLCYVRLPIITLKHLAQVFMWGQILLFS